MAKEMDIDITDKVSCWRDNDGEYLPLRQCVCGAKFELPGFQLELGRANSKTCDQCGRQMYFANTIRIFEVKR